MPRPRKHNIGGSALGVLVGGLMGGPGGAALGALLGAAGNSSTPWTLEESLAAALRDRNLALIALTRETHNQIKFVFTRQAGQYWSIRVAAVVAPGASLEKVDDDLFDLAVQKLIQWQAAHG